MPGPTAWPLTQQVIATGNQAITTTTETVIATLPNLNSRGSGYTIHFSGQAAFAVSAATTATTLRIRIGTVTGTIVGSAVIAAGATAGDLQDASGVVGGDYTPSQEIANATFVLTIQATAAAANWNTTYARLEAQQ